MPCLARVFPGRYPCGYPYQALIRWYNSPRCTALTTEVPAAGVTLETKRPSAEFDLFGRT